MYLLLALFLAFIMIVWFDTSAFAEYVELLNFKPLHPAIENYLKVRKQGSPQTFVEYLLMSYDNFFVRLITCPKCLATWLGGATGFITLIPACMEYGLIQGIACASALPYLTYIAYQISKKL